MIFMSEWKLNKDGSIYIIPIYRDYFYQNYLVFT